MGTQRKKLLLSKHKSVNACHNTGGRFLCSVYFKYMDMLEFKLKQFRYESDTWKQLLDFMTDENVRLKIKLSEVLKDHFDKNLLEDVERFQSSFINEDQLISLLKNDIAELDHFLAIGIYEDEISIQTAERKLKTLRYNINVAERKFVHLKSNFNHYLADNMKYG